MLALCGDPSVLVAWLLGDITTRFEKHIISNERMKSILIRLSGLLDPLFISPLGKNEVCNPFKSNKIDNYLGALAKGVYTQARSSSNKKS